MRFARTLGTVLLVGAVGVAAGIAVARQNQPETPPMQLPPGWTMADMQACMAAGTPGKMHQWLTKFSGTWSGKCEMMMAPGMPAVTTECTETISPILDGRYLKTEMSGSIPDMGPFSGMSFIGYDNVAEKFVGTWIDSMSTGIMTGTGELSADGKTLTWSFSYYCPITRKPVTLRQIETRPDDNTMHIEMFMPDPKTGKEYKGMTLHLTRSK